MATSARGRDPAIEEEFLGALYKGGELLASGKVVEAREHLEKANTLQPKNEKAQNLLGLTYFKLGLYEQAAAVYERLVNENPVDATLRVNLGLVFLKTNALERCVKEFETATDLEPTHKKAHNYLGLALAQQGQYAKAKEHFHLAGSDQMAEKMGRALSAQGPSPAEAPPRTVVLSPPPSAPPAEAVESAPVPEPQRPPPLPAARAAAAEAEAEEQPIEVMSDEEPLPDGEAPAEELEVAAASAPQAPPESTQRLASDWSEQLPAPPPSVPTVVVAEEMTLIEATVEVLPAEPLPEAASETPDWLTQEPAPAAVATETSQWVTESVADVPYPTQSPVPQEEPAPQTWEDTIQGPGAQAHWAQQSAEGTWDESQDAVAGAEGWPAQEAPPAADDARWATGAGAEVPEGAVQAYADADAAAWSAQQAQDAQAYQDYAAAQAEGAEQGQPAEALAAQPDDDSWATGGQAQAQAHAGDGEASAWAGTPEAEAQAEAEAGWVQPVAETPADDASWATGAATEPQPQDEAGWAEAQPAGDAQQEPQADDESWAIGPRTDTVEPERVEAAAPADAVPPPAPSAPLSITVEEPVSASAMAARGPAGYAPMSPQRLGDLGASGSWVQEPGAGPFHVGADGLAVTVAGEMLTRMEGLVAVVGSLEVKPETRRRRGRPTAEPFGQGPTQLQRVSGSGVVYLEPGRRRFHAVDLTDQSGISVDDDGAYLREELIFAFEEPISFENGMVSGEGQSLELAHLKGSGRVLLQLDGSLRAMPIPVGAPLVVPLPRVVGWFGRVTPRLMGFGGRGAIELTGEGYALLGTPAERA